MGEVMERWQQLFRSRRPRDAMAALVIAGPAAVGLLTGLHRTAPVSLSVYAAVAALCAVVVGRWRREYDWAATVVACATFLMTNLPYANYVMTYSLARRRRWALAVTCMGLLLVWPAHQLFFEPVTGPGRLFEFETSLPSSGLDGLVYWALAAVAPLAMGAAKNSLEEALTERERHAAQSAERQRRLRESTLRERSLTERARLASMMHDGVGHHVTVMVSMAGAISVDAAVTEPIRRRSELIVSVGQKAIGQLGEVLDVLSTPIGEIDGVADGFRIADIEYLVRDYRSLGVEVAYSPAAGPVCDSTGEDLCYRIVREALTNVLRHAGAPRADIRLTQAAGRLRLTVSSPVAPEDRPSFPGTGRGLRLLAEEAALAGGSLTAGSSADGARFVLEADLPLSRGGREAGEPMGRSTS
ncbi:sensor histidine kinase [Amycolatopsis thermalba]|uniref:sensor histidine kinase n=1 Tax=Amycolatopsis thermalba TaxID=944492 RepID=UPI000E22173A|nr:ATP-binding protein [Amycolatopsis thermalba]